MVAFDAVSAEFNETVNAKGMPSSAWPIGFLVGLGLLVGLSIWAAPEDQGGPPVDTAAAQATAKPMPSARSAQFELFIPAAGDVVLGSCVPVAGRGAPPKGRPLPAQPASVTVVILDGERGVGEGTLPIANGTFIGCIDVESPSRGRRVELFASFTTHPTRALTHVTFILAAKSNPDR